METPTRPVAIVVEDNADVLDVTATLIEEQGFHVLRASTSAEAVALVDGGVPVDLLFTDVILPGMNGLELSHRVRERRPEAAVIFATGWRDAVSSASQLGYNVLLKPYGVDDLQRALADVHPLRRQTKIDGNLELALRHLQTGVRLIGRQRTLVNYLMEHGRNSDVASRLLVTMEDSFSLMRSHVDRITRVTF